MKKELLVGLFLFVVGLPTYVLSYYSISPFFIISQSEEVQEKVIKVNGMDCEKCERAIEKEVRKVPGVIEVKADHKSGTCKVKMKAGTDINAIFKAIEKAGYKPAGEG